MKVDDGRVMELEAVDGIAGGENPVAGLQQPEVAKQFRSIFPEEVCIPLDLILNLYKLSTVNPNNLLIYSSFFTL